jgi:beta-glucosidase
VCLHPDLARLLRGQLGFEGFVITDEGSITFAGPGYHGYVSSVEEAACLALYAGVDLALGGEFGPHLGACVASGRSSEARVNEALTRLLRAQLRLGWFDSVAARLTGASDPVSYNNVSVAANVSTPAARALARRAAAEGLVLLKNDARTLPLRAGAALRRVALVGPAASYDNTSTSSVIGNYAACTDGPGGAATADARCHIVTLAEALAAAGAARGFAVSFVPGTDINRDNETGIAAAVASAAGADVIVLAAGLDTCQETFCSEGEANDRLDTLALRGAQPALLAALRAAHPTTPLVLVLANGGPVSDPAALAAADAVLEAWYAGEEAGSAIVAALLGDESPAGRLPVTLVSGLGELPEYTSTRMDAPPGRTHRYYSGTPLRPFGFGLSYVNFSYSALSIAPGALDPAAPDATFTVSATLLHGGGMAADEVVQLYGSYAGAAGTGGLASPPRQQLLAFTRLHALAPGGSTPVSFTLPAAALQLVAPDGAMCISPGTWTLTLGGGPPANAQFGGGDVLVGTLVVAAAAADASADAAA